MRDPHEHSSGRTSALESTGRASKVPRKHGLPRWRHGQRVHRQLQMPQVFLDDTSLHNHRNDPQGCVTIIGVSSFWGELPPVREVNSILASGVKQI